MIGIVIAALLPLLAFADTIAFDFTPAEGTNSAPAFDSSLGTLDAVALGLSIRGTLSLGFSNSTSTTGFFNGSFAPTVGIYGLPSYQWLSGGTVLMSGAVQPFGTYTDWRSVDFTGSPAIADTLGQVSLPWALTLAPNPGPWAVYWDRFLSGPSSGLTLDQVALSGEYEYTPAVHHMPEPGYFVAIGVVLAALWAGAGGRHEFQALP